MLVFLCPENQNNNKYVRKLPPRGDEDIVVTVQSISVDEK
jgi:hypothetical protein